MPTNDNNAGEPGAPPRVADPHGQAALLLVESLIHGLCERSVISVADAVLIVERAIDVQEDVVEVADGAAAPMWRSHALLIEIAESLKADRDGHDDNVLPIL